MNKQECITVGTV